MVAGSRVECEAGPVQQWRPTGSRGRPPSALTTANQRQDGKYSIDTLVPMICHCLAYPFCLSLYRLIENNPNNLKQKIKKVGSVYFVFFNGW